MRNVSTSDVEMMMTISKRSFNAGTNKRGITKKGFRVWIGKWYTYDGICSY